MMVVVAIIGLIAAVAFPSASAGVESVRLVSATDSVATFLNAAVNRAELDVIAEGRTAADAAAGKKPSAAWVFALVSMSLWLICTQQFVIEAVLPGASENPENSEGVRRFLLLPGATVPGIGVQIANRRGARRIVRLDPMTGFPRVESPAEGGDAK